MNHEKKNIAQNIGISFLSTAFDTFSTHTYIQGVPGGKDLTPGGCSLGQTIPI